MAFRWSTCPVSAAQNCARSRAARVICSPWRSCSTGVFFGASSMARIGRSALSLLQKTVAWAWMWRRTKPPRKRCCRHCKPVFFWTAVWTSSRVVPSTPSGCWACSLPTPPVTCCCGCMHPTQPAANGVMCRGTCSPSAARWILALTLWPMACWRLLNGWPRQRASGRRWPSCTATPTAVFPTSSGCWPRCSRRKWACSRTKACWRGIRKPTSKANPLCAMPCRPAPA